LRIEERCVSRESDRDRAVTLFEQDPLFSQRINIRSLSKLFAVRADVIGSLGVQSDKDDVVLRIRRAGIQSDEKEKYDENGIE
jgi:hypothetical protein